MRFPFVATILFLTAFSLPHQAQAAQPSPPASEDMKALKILARNCAGCHQAADHPGAMFLNQEQLTQPETIALIRKLVETSQMPPAHRDFKTSKDGKALLKWLKKQPK